MESGLGNLKDRSGRVYGKLTVLNFHGRGKSGALWKCRCACGNIVVRTRSGLIQKTPPSCGCTRMREEKHGHCKGKVVTNTYRSWDGVFRSCGIFRSKARLKYSRKNGPKVCERWCGVNAFVNFLADMGERPPQTVLRRIDISKDFEPTNCVWGPPMEPPPRWSGTQDVGGVVGSN